MSFYYLASPYSKYPDGLDAAFILAAENAAILVRAGVPVYSPIAHTHPVAIYGGIDPYDHSIWIPADTPMMESASALIVLRAEGWQESKGMAIEIDAFRRANKPVVYMTPGQMPDEIRK